MRYVAELNGNFYSIAPISSDDYNALLIDKRLSGVRGVPIYVHLPDSKTPAFWPSPITGVNIFRLEPL